MQVQNIDLSPLQAEAGGKTLLSSDRIAALAGVKAELTVVAGRAQSQVGELLNLREGAVLPLDTPLNAPFDLMLGDTLIARGELVAVGDQFGIRIVQAGRGQAA